LVDIGDILTDLDTLLSMIENPTRRRILEALVREPHYPLQLSRELGMSQQAIMKHLKVLEDYNLVRSYPEASDQGGPARKRYVPTTKFTIIVDFGPGLFNVETMAISIDAGREASVQRPENQRSGIAEIGAALDQLRGTVAQIDAELEQIQSERSRLIDLKERAMQQADRIIEENITDYQVRRIVYEYVQNPKLSPRGIAKELGLRDEQVEGALDRLKED
jgi:ArsR family transcriptional regulator